MRLETGLAAGLAFFLSAAGCHPPVQSPALTLVLETVPAPPRAGPVKMTLRLTGADSRPVVGARVDFEADMTHAGMAPVFGHAHEDSPGRYAAAVEFTMAGDWVVLVHVRLAGGQQVEKQVEIRGVKPE